MKKIKITPYFTMAFIACILAASCQNDSNAQNSSADVNLVELPTQADPLPTEKRHPSKKIKIALLLDTSNSMDGLIDQTKSQLWDIVNKLADAECEGMRPKIEIALYEYGNSKLTSNSGFIRQVTSLTTDLDQLSEDLFSLTTKGGSEHCGQVIYTSLNELQWSESTNDLQVIFIAGNEPFTQGPVSYYKACRLAKQNNVVINTIFCGDFQEGIGTFWKDGAILTGGEYMSINHNSKTVYIPSPYDDRIGALNSRLNDTYIHYGSQGYERKMKQEKQDGNALSFSQENMVNRAVSKSKHIYKNSSWDLVDAIEEKEVDLEVLEEADFNEEMKGLSLDEKKSYITEKAEERRSIQNEINSLNAKRQEYIKQRQQQTDVAQLDQVMLNAIRKQAKQRNILF